MKRSALPARYRAWNAIRIDGQWRRFDAKWGEGYGNEAEVDH
jgi:transglutaminase/protease-like cytokinesis protein 3